MLIFSSLLNFAGNMDDTYGYSSRMLPIHSAKSVEVLNQSNYERFASVKQRINGSKRISMEELERLMERQGQGTSQFQPIPIYEVFFHLFSYSQISSF